MLNRGEYSPQEANIVLNMKNHKPAVKVLYGQSDIGFPSHRFSFQEWVNDKGDWEHSRSSSGPGTLEHCDDSQDVHVGPSLTNLYARQLYRTTVANIRQLYRTTLAHIGQWYGTIIPHKQDIGYHSHKELPKFPIPRSNKVK